MLESRNTKLAVVEAKAWDKPLSEGVRQAKDYAGKLAIRFTSSKMANWRAAHKIK